MICKFLNKTPEPQQINFYDGSAITVAPSGTAEIDKDKIYLEEIERLKRFFNIEEFKLAVPEGNRRRVKKTFGDSVEDEKEIIIEGEE
jgi:hypothetical protein